MNAFLRTVWMVACAPVFSFAAPASADEAGDLMVSMTASIQEVACIQCVSWNGVGGAPRHADKLLATVLTPAHFAGQRIQMFVWEDESTPFYLWLPGTVLSFGAVLEEMKNRRVILPRAYVRLVTD